jgi:Flavin containing amine oxidoreductase
MGSSDCDWPEIVNFHKIAGWPVLLAFSAGAAGEKNELRSDSELVAAPMISLRKMYGKEIPEPSGYLVTRWDQDPYSLGSYSYVAVGSKQSLRRQIGMPVEERVVPIYSRGCQARCYLIDNRPSASTSCTNIPALAMTGAKCRSGCCRRPTDSCTSSGL